MYIAMHILYVIMLLFCRFNMFFANLCNGSFTCYDADHNYNISSTIVELQVCDKWLAFEQTN